MDNLRARRTTTTVFSGNTQLLFFHTLLLKLSEQANASLRHLSLVDSSAHTCSSHPANQDIRTTASNQIALAKERRRRSRARYLLFVLLKVTLRKITLWCQSDPVSRIESYFAYVLLSSQDHGESLQTYCPTSMRRHPVIKRLKMILESFRIQTFLLQPRD